MRKPVTILLLSICMATGQIADAQPFAAEIAAFAKQDSLQAPPLHPILFVGSSSFTMWTGLQQDFPGFPVLNRGFGGSSLTDLIYYQQEVIIRYNPKQIVMYCGENDIAGDSAVTGNVVFSRFQNLYTSIRKALPNVPFLYISMKPSPSRWHLRKQMQSGNRRIQRFLRKEKHAQFLNIWTQMTGANGLPLPDIYLEDQLHMNAKGYSIWRTYIQPKLIK